MLCLFTNSLIPVWYSSKARVSQDGSTGTICHHLPHNNSTLCFRGTNQDSSPLICWLSMGPSNTLTNGARTTKAAPTTGMRRVCTLLDRLVSSLWHTSTLCSLVSSHLCKHGSVLSTSGRKSRLKYVPLSILNVSLIFISLCMFQLILPYVDLKLLSVDLSLKSRDDHDDQPVKTALRLLKKNHIGVKCATLKLD